MPRTKKSTKSQRRRIARKSVRKSKKPSTRYGHGDFKLTRSLGTIVPDQMRITLPWKGTVLSVPPLLGHMYEITPIRLSTCFDILPLAAGANEMEPKGLSLWKQVYRNHRVINNHFKLNFRVGWDDETKVMDTVQSGKVGYWIAPSGGELMYPDRFDLDMKGNEGVLRKIKKMNFCETPQITIADVAGDTKACFSHKSFKGSVNTFKAAETFHWGTITTPPIVPTLSIRDLNSLTSRGNAVQPGWQAYMFMFMYGDDPVLGSAGVNTIPSYEIDIDLRIDVVFSNPYRRGDVRVLAADQTAYVPQATDPTFLAPYFAEDPTFNPAVFQQTTASFDADVL